MSRPRSLAAFALQAGAVLLAVLAGLAIEAQRRIVARRRWLAVHRRALALLIGQQAVSKVGEGCGAFDGLAHCAHVSFPFGQW
jgi:hypothetical protein